MVGIFTLAIILFFPIEIIRDGMAAYLKKKYNIDLLKEAKDDVIKDLTKDFMLLEEEKDKIYASATTGSLATATADIIINKKICSSCKKREMKEIPWREEFNRCIQGEHSEISNQHAYKCDNCGNMFIQYDEI